MLEFGLIYANDWCVVGQAASAWDRTCQHHRTAKLAVRLACHANPSPLLLRDGVQATLPLSKYSMPESTASWIAGAEQPWARSSREVVVEILDRALSNFTTSPGPASLGGPPTFITVNRDFVAKLGGTDL